MRIVIKAWVALLLPLIAALAGCSGSPSSLAARSHEQPAHLYVIKDVSVSPGDNNDAREAEAVQRQLTDDVSHLQLGDTITLYEAGARSADRLVAHPTIATDYNLRISAATTKLAEEMREIAGRYRAEGGDGQTNLLLTLEAINPHCTPRSTVDLVTDGVEESEAASIGRTLNAGKPVVLPTPPGRYLAGCHLRFLGFGITVADGASKPELLPARQLAALQRGWLAYLTQSGVRPEDVEFVSAL